MYFIGASKLVFKVRDLEVRLNYNKIEITLN